MFPLALIASTLTSLIFPIFSLDHAASIVALPAIGLMIDMALLKKSPARLLPLPWQLLLSALLLLELIGGKERSEFPHFEVSPAIDLPLSHLLLLLTTIIILKRGTRGAVVWIAAISIGCAAHLITSIGGHYNFSILPVTALSLLLLLGTMLTTERTETDKRIGMLLTGGCFLILSVFLVDALRLTSTQEQCGSPTLTPPEPLVRFLFAAEDPRFLHHHGVDFHRLRIALRDTIQEGRYKRGGSTITMQYAKVCFLTQEKTLLRKARQISTALILEFSLTKSEILSRYLSSIPLGERTIGMTEAAMHYFSKPPYSMTDEEALSLVMTVFDPESYNPNLPPTASERVRRAVIKARSRNQLTSITARS